MIARALDTRRATRCATSLSRIHFQLLGPNQPVAMCVTVYPPFPAFLHYASKLNHLLCGYTAYSCICISKYFDCFDSFTFFSHLFVPRL